MLLTDINNQYNFNSTNEKISNNSITPRQSLCISFKKIYQFKSSLFTNKSRILAQQLFCKSMDIDLPKNDNILYEESSEIPKIKKKFAYRISKKKVNFAKIMSDRKINSQTKNERINSSNINYTNTIITNFTNKKNKHQISTKVSNNNSKSKHSKKLIKKIILKNVNETNKKNNTKTLIKINENITLPNKNTRVIQNYNNKSVKKPVDKNISRKDKGLGNIVVLYPIFSSSKKIKVTCKIKKDDNTIKENKNLEIKKLNSIDKPNYDKNRLHNENTMKKSNFVGNKIINYKMKTNEGYYLKYKKNKRSVNHSKRYGNSIKAIISS